MLRDASLLLLAGALLALLGLAAGGRVAPGDAGPLLAALEAQVPVESWDADQAARRLEADLLVVDGRPEADHRAGAPAGSLPVPFERRSEEAVVLPVGRQVGAVLVVMEAGRATEARELAQWLAREWALREVATLRGGWRAWCDAGLPREPEADR